MCYKSEILAFKPVFDAIIPVLRGRERFYRPLHAFEVNVAVHFGGIYYEGRGLTDEEKGGIMWAQIAFKSMQIRCPQIISCDMYNLEYPFTVQIPFES